MADTQTWVFDTAAYVGIRTAAIPSSTGPFAVLVAASLAYLHQVAAVAAAGNADHDAESQSCRIVEFGY